MYEYDFAYKKLGLFADLMATTFIELSDLRRLHKHLKKAETSASAVMQRSKKRSKSNACNSILLNAAIASPFPKQFETALNAGFEMGKDHGVPFMATTLVMCHPVQSKILATQLVEFHKDTVLNENQKWQFKSLLNHILGLEEAVEAHNISDAQNALICFYDTEMLFADDAEAA
jgi:hypothetical protein